jgi:hypothetical protein
MLGPVRLEWSEAELLASHEVAEPLVVGGVRCHGGFLADGTYVPPRTRNRVPAIEAWQANHTATFGTDLLEAPVGAWPENYPNLAQTRLLLEHGVREPVVAILTRIGTVEGFGAMIRHAPVPDWRACLVEDVAGTALAHLDRGLFEAHARDEAGFGAEGGHRQMWFAARDIAFENPPTEDETERMLARMGIAGPGGGPGPLAAPPRALPPDVPAEVEVLVERMVRLLMIEVSAFHTFAWAEAVLSDPALVAGDGEAARLVACVRADETPHVEYLRTALTELRDRTVVGTSGRRYPGAEVVGRLFERAMADSLGPRRRQLVEQTDAEVARALAGRRDAADLFAAYKALAPAA